MNEQVPIWEVEEAVVGSLGDIRRYIVGRFASEGNARACCDRLRGMLDPSDVVVFDRWSKDERTVTRRRYALLGPFPVRP